MADIRTVCAGGKGKRAGARWILIAGLFLLISGNAYSADKGGPASDVRQIDGVRRANIEDRVGAEIERKLNLEPTLEGQKGPFKVRAQFAIRENQLRVELGRNFIPAGKEDNMTGDIADRIQELHSAIYAMLRKDINGNVEIVFTFGGKTTVEMFPSHFPNSEKLQSGSRSTPAVVVPKTVVINPGHGWYYRINDHAWVLQRPLIANSYIEDEYTALIASHLRSFLTSRSAVDVLSTRDSSTDYDPTSNKRWDTMASRYYMQKLYPTDLALWHSNADDTSNTRDYDEDINARPYFANKINANTMISIHTNGSSDISVRGAEFWYRSGRESSRKLALLSACYVKEIVTSDPQWTNYVVDLDPKAGTHGEYTLVDANRDAILVELGYATNDLDRAAITNYLFQELAMKGVEKGYRLHAAGGSVCEALKINSVAPVVTPRNVLAPVTIAWVGHPQTQLKMTSKYFACPTGFTCGTAPWTNTYASTKTDAIVWNWRCTMPASASGNPGGTFTIEAYLSDSDGVRSPKFQYQVTCT